MTITYRAEHFTVGGALVFIGNIGQVSDWAFLSDPLPQTNGQLQIVRALVDGPARPTEVTPVLRNWGDGQVYFQSLEVTPLAFDN